MVEALAEILTLGFNLNLHENTNSESNGATDNSSASHGSSHPKNCDLSQDTAEKPMANVMKRHQSSSNTNSEHNLSSQLSVQPSNSQSGKHLSRTPVQQRSAHRTHLSARPSHNLNHNHNEVDGEASYDDDETHRRHHRSVTHRNHQVAAVAPKNHDSRVNRVPTDRRSDEGIPLPLPRQPFRLIFMRHSERVNQVLGADWLYKAFRNNTYQQYDENLPMILPQRRSYQDFEFDSPLTSKRTGNEFIEHLSTFFFD